MSRKRLNYEMCTSDPGDSSNDEKFIAKLPTLGCRLVTKSFIEDCCDVGKEEKEEGKGSSGDERGDCSQEELYLLSSCCISEEGEERGWRNFSLFLRSFWFAQILFMLRKKVFLDVRVRFTAHIKSSQILNR